MTDFAPGTLLADRFTVTGVLGRGGMATVYLVEDRVRQVAVALKVLHPHLAADSTMQRRLRREVQAAGLVRHEAALVANELYEVQGTLALSMPFHSGRTLASKIAEEGPLPPDEVRALGQRIAGALAEAHRHGVLHHDVTANNVLLTAGGDAVLTDFGLARVHDGTSGTATSVMGTPGYAAPEIYDGERSDPRSDLYSLGVLLYLAATGDVPFGRGNPAGVLRRQIDAAFTPPEVACPGLPADLAHTIRSLLARDPNQRPPSANEVAAALAGSTPAYVPEQPDTWNLDDVQRPVEVPDSTAPLVPHAGTIELPVGTSNVVLSRGMIAKLDDALCRLTGNPRRVSLHPPEKLTSALERAYDLPANELARTPALDTAHFRLVDGVDPATARRLADLAETLGYEAKVYDGSPLTGLERVARLWWIPTACIGLAILVSMMPFFQALPYWMGLVLFAVIAKPFARRETPAGLPLAFGRELLLHVAPSAASQPEAPIPEPPLGVVLRAQRSLDALNTAIEALELSAVEQRDLESTVSRLRTQANELSSQVHALRTELDAEPAPADVSWVHERLVRLDTLEAAGQTIEPQERDRLHKALLDHGASDDAREALEGRWAAAMAQLLEIAATAERSRRELLLADTTTHTGPRVVERLSSEIDAVARARQELAARQASRQRS